jgi:ribosomal protein S27E
LKAETALTCSECGEELVVHEFATRMSCPGCGKYHYPLSQPAAGAPLIAIRTLTAELQELEKQQETLSERWGLVDLVRNTGFILILTGIGYMVLNNLTSLSMLTHGVYAIITGILLHAGSQLVGKGYYVQKAFLKELVVLKQNEIEQHRARPLKSGNIPS